MSEEFVSKVFEAPPSKVAQLMASGQTRDGFWQPNELGEVLRHQLAAPLHAGNISGVGSKTSTGPNRQCGSGQIRNLGELFLHPQPPLDLLEQAKEFAKANRKHPDGPLPADVSTVIYFAAIVVALLRCGKRITKLDDRALRDGIAWVVMQPWVDSQIRALFVEAQRVLSQ